MTPEQILRASGQSAVLFLMVWSIFQLAPSVGPNAKSWIWRLAFMKPILVLVPLASVTLAILPTPAPEIPTSSISPVGDSVAVVDVPHSALAEAGTPTADPLLIGWLVGALFVGGYGLAGAVRARRIVRRATTLSDDEILETLTALCRNARYSAPIRLAKSCQVSGVMLVGGKIPTIVLPAQSLPAQSPADVRMMLAHEVAHLVRKDLLWFGFTWVVQSIFFFNPMVWVAARSARLDHESATDRYAAQLAAVPIQTYAEMLLRATVVARTSFVPGALPMAESHRTIHRRLEAMKHFNCKPTRAGRFATAALAIATAGLLPFYQLAEAAPVPSLQSSHPKAGSKNDKVTTKNKPKDWIAKATPAKSVPKNDKPVKGNVPTSGSSNRTTPNGQGGVSVSGSRGGSISGGGFVSTGGEAAKRGMKEAEAFMKAHTNDGKLLPPQTPTLNMPTNSGSDPNKISTSGSATGSASGAGFGKVTRIVDGKEETISSSSSQNSTSTSWSKEYSYGSGGFTPHNGGGSSQSSGAISGENTANGNKITFKFENYDARAALTALFRQVDRKVVVDASLKGTLTAAANGVSFDSALQTLLRSINGTFRVEDGTYVLSVRR